LGIQKGKGNMGVPPINHGVRLFISVIGEDISPFGGEALVSYEEGG